MRSARWNWTIFIAVGATGVLLGVLGIIGGALNSTSAPLVYITVGIGFIVSGIFVRRAYRAYEKDAMANAAEVMESELVRSGD